jgi:RNA polymerase sigma factor (sigma-70 family)
MMDAGRGVLTRELGRLFGEGVLPLSDGQLLEQYVSRRDEAAFEALVHEHGPMVLALCRRHLRDPADVEDAFQATFLVLVRKAATIRRRELLSNWLYGVAYKVSTRARSNRLKRHGRETDRVDLLECPPEPSPLESAELDRVLDQELTRLPEKYRAPLLLCYLKERTHEQAAAELSWPVGTVRSRLARGRTLLRDRMTRRGYAPSAAIFGLAFDLPSRTFTAPVPPSLARATVAAAEGFMPAGPAGAVAAAGSTVLFPHLSGSAPTLAQGVLTTMALTQMKVIGAGLVAAGMLAGGVGAGAWALGSSGPGPQTNKPSSSARSADQPPAKPSENPPVPSSLPPPVGVTRSATATPVTDREVELEARLANLERKLDRLLELREVPPPKGSFTRRQSVRPRAPATPFEPEGLGQPTLRGPTPDAVPSPALQPGTRSAPAASDIPAPSEPPPSDSLPPTAPTGLPVPSANVPDLAPRSEPVEDLTPQPPQPTRERSPFDDDRPAAARHSSRVRPSPGAPVRDQLPTLPDDPQLAQNAQPAERDDVEPAGADTSRPRSLRRSLPTLLDRPSERASLRELEAQVRAAVRRHQLDLRMFSQGIVGRDQLESSADEIRLLDARLRGLDEALAEERDLLKVERVRKQSELSVAQAQAELASKTLTGSANLFRNNAISREEMAKCETEAKIAPAQVDAKRAEVQEVELRMAQIDRRRTAISSVLLSLVKVIKGLDANTETPAPPTAPSS